MKILYVDQTGQLGGGEIAILPWLRHTRADAHVALFEDGPFRRLLEESGISVDVLALDTLKEVRRESGLMAVLTALPAMLRLRGQLAKLASRFDAVYANSQKAFLLAALSKRRGQPLVWHLRDILTADHFSGLMRKVAIAFGNRMATVVVVNSNATAESFVAAGGRRDKVRVVHDGVSPEPFDQVEPNHITELRKEIAPHGVLLVGLFGRISNWKGQHILLEALSELPGVHGVLVGSPLFGEDIYEQGLRERASNPDLEGRIHFMGFRRDIPALMRAMDIIAHTSIAAEPFGLVIVEGMLAEKPVIATRAGGAMEIIEDGESGVLVTPGSIAELRDAICDLQTNAAKSERLAKAGRKRAEELFSLPTLLRGISSVLEDLKNG